MIVIQLGDDSARVVANKCDNNGGTRDDKIARQVAQAIKHALMPDDFPKPMRMTDEPIPLVEVEK